MRTFIAHIAAFPREVSHHRTSSNVPQACVTSGDLLFDKKFSRIFE
jgi:hypothetical protein